MIPIFYPIPTVLPKVLLHPCGFPADTRSNRHAAIYPLHIMHLITVIIRNSPGDLGNERLTQITWTMAVKRLYALVNAIHL